MMLASFIVELLTYFVPLIKEVADGSVLRAGPSALANDVEYGRLL